VKTKQEDFVTQRSTTSILEKAMSWKLSHSVCLYQTMPLASREEKVLMMIRTFIMEKKNGSRNQEMLMMT